MLDGEFNRVQAKVKQTIDKADCIAVISDGWSNLRGQGIINFIISTPRPVFYKSTDTKDNRHTGPYIADELKAVINDLGPKKVFTLVTVKVSRDVDSLASHNHHLVAWKRIEQLSGHSAFGPQLAY